MLGTGVRTQQDQQLGRPGQSSHACGSAMRVLPLLVGEGGTSRSMASKEASALPTASYLHKGSSFRVQGAFCGFPVKGQTQAQ